MKNVFLFGCPRSGTTWLQLLLYQHPQITSSQETHLFDWYLGPLFKTFNNDFDNENTKRKVGLSEIISKDDVNNILSYFVQKVMTNIIDKKQGATVVLEKTPKHIWFWDLILYLLPESYFIHIIRDPRSVVSSMKAAKNEWGPAIAPPGGTVAASKRWVSDVNQGRRLNQFTKNYLEIKYENLLEDGASQLNKILTFIDIPHDENMILSMIDTCKISNFKKHNANVKAPWSLSTDPKSFYRKGSSTAWKKDLSKRQLRLVEYISRDLMLELGYSPSTYTRFKPVSILFYELTISFLKFIFNLIPKSFLDLIRFSILNQGR